MVLDQGLCAALCNAYPSGAFLKPLSYLISISYKLQLYKSGLQALNLKKSVLKEISYYSCAVIFTMRMQIAIKGHSKERSYSAGLLKSV